MSRQELEELWEIERRALSGQANRKPIGTPNWGDSIGPITGPIAEPQVLAEVMSKSPRPWSVTCGVSTERIAGVLGPIPPDSGDSFITLEWGSGGAKAAVEIDCSRGWTCTVFGSFVRAALTYPTFIQAAASPAPLTIAAFIGEGGSGRQQPELYRSVRYSDLAPTDSQSRGIPRFAERLFFQADTGNSVGANIDLRLGFQVQDGAVTVQEFRWRDSTDGYQAIIGQGIPVARDAQLCRLINQGAVNLDFPTCIYRLKF